MSVPEHLSFYIDGEWVPPAGKLVKHDVIDPATEEPTARIAIGSKADVDRAVAAARRAFETFSETTKDERVALLQRFAAALKKRIPEMAAKITSEMGAPKYLADTAQAAGPVGLLGFTIKALQELEFEERRGGKHLVRHEPIGVCGLITPWNWPTTIVTMKVAAALAAGCTVILKPSELAPLDAIVVAEALHEAGVPPGVFNLINGDGPGVGHDIASHPGIDMISFTGSGRAGILVAEAAAPTVKRVCQELGGKSANIITADAPLEKAVSKGILDVMNNSGQTCVAPTRMLVPRSRYEEAVAIATKVAGSVKVADPKRAAKAGDGIGPLANAAQYKKVTGLIRKGIEEGARVIAGGDGRPEGFERGYFVKPTVFADVRNDMRIAREEIFGPVLCMIPYSDVDEAVRIANETTYGLAGYVYAKDTDSAAKIARRLKAGLIGLQGSGAAFDVPVGGYRQSGNGREGGKEGIFEFMEVKAIINAHL
ncbi:aldehyde dehydrogenase family protein [Hyaloraphidium curvatum]|nr:aldehyde dehydrogenase family protein [Hyaloraphidium curvatum]